MVLHSSAVSNVKGDNEGIGVAAAAYFVSCGMQPGDEVYVYEGDTSSVTTLRDQGFKEYLLGNAEFEDATIEDSLKVDRRAGGKCNHIFRSNELEQIRYQDRI